jgi:hypothetical protein
MALAAFLTMALAVGQIPPGQTAQHDELQPMAVRSRRLAHCVLGRARTASTDFVVGAADEKQERRDRSAIEQALGGCMSYRDASVTLAVDDLRGDLAEQLLIENDRALLGHARAQAPVVAQRLNDANGDLTDAVFGCAVAAKPGSAAAMLDASPATPEESAAFRELADGLQACVPIHYELHIAPYLVRRTVAVALYRLVAKSTGV